METQAEGGAPHIQKPWQVGQNMEGPELPLPTRRLLEAADTYSWVGGDLFK